MMPDATGLHGPTTPTPEQVRDVAALANRVFRPDGRGDMGEQYPLLFDPDRTEQMRIYVRDDTVVSHVGVRVDEVLLCGATVRMACIGAVCTDTDARGQGLAGALFKDAVRYAMDLGASVMLISGDRSLYRRAGAYPAGRFLHARAERSLLDDRAGDIELQRVTPAEAPDALRLFETESIRFRRTSQDYAAQLACGMLCNRPGQTWQALVGGSPVAVVSCFALPADEGRGITALCVEEMAGDRRAALTAAGRLAAEQGAPTVTVTGHAADHALAAVLAEIGAAVEHRPFHPGSTIKLLDLPRLWTDARPLLRERIGDAAERIVVTQTIDEDGVVQAAEFAFDGQRVKIEGAEAVVHTFLGRPDGQAMTCASGRLGELLGLALPLPLPMYGLNYT